MPANVQGAAAVVVMVRLALHGPQSVLSEAAFNSQKLQATANPWVYANQQAAAFAAIDSTDTAFTTRVLGHMGLLPNPLLIEAVAAYFSQAGVNNRGIVVLQIAQLLSSLETDPSFGPAAAAWNLAVTQANSRFSQVDEVAIVGDEWNDVDVFDGGDGINEMRIHFSTATDPVRSASMQRFQTAQIVFDAPVTLDAAKVDGLESLLLGASSQRARIVAADAALNTGVIQGSLAQGLSVAFDPGGTAGFDLSIRDAAREIGSGPGLASLEILGAKSLTIRQLAPQDVLVNGGVRLNDDPAQGPVTRSLDVEAPKTHALRIVGLALEQRVPAVIVDGNALETLTLQAGQRALIEMGSDSVAALAEAGSLRDLSLSTGTMGELIVGRIGIAHTPLDAFSPAFSLDDVQIVLGPGSTITQYGIDAANASRDEGAALDRVQIDAELGATLRLMGWASSSHTRSGTNGGAWLLAESVQRVEVSSSGLSVRGGVQLNGDFDGDEASEADVQFGGLIGMHLSDQDPGSTMVLSGSATMPGWIFDGEAPEFIDASGLQTAAPGLKVRLDDLVDAAGYRVGNSPSHSGDRSFGFAVVIDDGEHHIARHKVDINGSPMNDFISAGGGPDVLRGHDGEDLLVGWGGNDTLIGGPGNDILYGDAIRPNANPGSAIGGADWIEGGEGDDLIVGGLNKQGLPDRLWGGAGADTFAFVLDSTHLPLGASEAGRTASPIAPDLIHDFQMGVDRIVIQHLQGDNHYAIAVYASVGAIAGFVNAEAQDVQVVVRRGWYNHATGQFTHVDVGPDLQLLFMADGADFGSTVAQRQGSPNLFFGGDVDAAAASHEIGLIGLGPKMDLIGTHDLVFI